MNRNAQNGTFVFRAMFAALLSLSFLNSPVQADPIPVETLAKPPNLSSLSLSRDGDYLVGLVGRPGDDKLSLAVWDTKNLSAPPQMVKPSGDAEFIGANALKAGKILVLTRKKWSGVLAGCGEGNLNSSTKTYLFKTMVTDIEFSDFDEPFSGFKKDRNTSEFEEVCSQIVGTGGIAADLPLDSENVIIASQSSVFDQRADYIKYNLRTGEKDKLYSRSGGENIALIHPVSGEVLAKSFSDYGDGRYKQKFKLRNKTGDFETHEELTSDSQNRYNMSVLGLDEENGKYYVGTDKFSDKSRIYYYDPGARKFDPAPLFQNDKFDVTQLLRSDREGDFGKVVGYRVDGANVEIEYIDPEFNSIQKRFKSQLPGKSVRIVDWSNDRKVILVSTEAANQPPSYFIALDGENFSFLGSRIPELAKANLAPSKLIYYPSRDGLKIPGILTMPVGWKDGDAAPPAIIHPHGGPWARDYAGWDASGWVPFLSSRGYAVLQPQYRGSTGWGREIWLSGDAEWGQKMQDDKDDGAQWMIEKGYADADRLAIFGYSYGGFAAFAAAVRDDGPYKCAIAGAGVSDLSRLGRLWSDNPLQRAYQGKTVKGMDPMKNVDDVVLPMLIFHGDRDVRVPLYHGKSFYKKIKGKVPAKLVVIKDQPHSLPWSEKMQLESLNAIEDYLKNDCFAN